MTVNYQSRIKQWIYHYIKAPTPPGKQLFLQTELRDRVEAEGIKLPHDLKLSDYSALLNQRSGLEFWNFGSKYWAKGDRN